VASQIADGLGCPISALLAEEAAPRFTVQRRAKRKAIVDKATGIERQSLSPALLRHGVEVVWYVVPPGRASGTFPAQGTGVVGHLTVVIGSLECTEPSNSVRLGPGDSLDYPGDIRHSFRNPGSRPCEFILVLSARHA
jgi:mannose-6-phosphate isomerase-like protein (cupin superfamily)